MTMPLCVRWTISDVGPFGLEALRLSIWGAFRAFGPRARYVVCVQGLAATRARALLGATPDGVDFYGVDPSRLPRWLAREGVTARAAARFAPPSIDPDRAELALDRSCVLLQAPAAMLAWLRDPDPRACIVLEDDDGAPSTALRGVGVGFDLEEALREAQRETPRELRGAEALERLELHALSLLGPPHRLPRGQLGDPGGASGARLRPPTDAASRERWARDAAELRAQLGVPAHAPPSRTAPPLL
jgi:hypothetical protein